jgi:hypothetical protein
MINRSVPYRDWFEFFGGFTRRHRGEPVTVTVAGEAIGVHREARHLPLGGIVADRNCESLSILIGGPTGGSVGHPIEDPVWVWLELDDAGNEVALEIESQDGLRTIVELAAVPVPESA